MANQQPQQLADEGSGANSHPAKGNDPKEDSFHIAAAPTIRLMDEVSSSGFFLEHRVVPYPLERRSATVHSTRPKPSWRVGRWWSTLRRSSQETTPDPLGGLMSEPSETSGFLAGFALLSAALTALSSVGLVLSFLALIAGVAHLRLESPRRRARGAWAAIAIASVGIGARLALMAWRVWHQPPANG